LWALEWVYHICVRGHRTCSAKKVGFSQKNLGTLYLYQYLFRRTTSNTISDKLSIGESLASLPPATWQLNRAGSYREEEKGRTQRDTWRNHYQPLPGYWATSCSISGPTPFPIRLPLSPGPCWRIGNRKPDLQFLKVQYAYWDLELDCRLLGKDDEASAGR